MHRRSWYVILYLYNLLIYYHYLSYLLFYTDQRKPENFHSSQKVDLYSKSLKAISISAARFRIPSFII